MSELKFEIGKTYEVCGGFQYPDDPFSEESGLAKAGDTFKVVYVDNEGWPEVPNSKYFYAAPYELENGSCKLVEDEKVEDTSHSPDLELHASTMQQGLKWDLIHMYIKDKFNGDAEEATTSGTIEITFKGGEALKIFSGKPPEGSNILANLKVTPEPIPKGDILEDGLVDLNAWMNNNSNGSGVVSSGPPQGCSEDLRRGYYKFTPNSPPGVSEELLGSFHGNEEAAKHNGFMMASQEEIDDGTKAVTGGSSPSYYRKSMSLPLTSDRTEFVTVDLETTDVIEAWNLNFNEGNTLKSTLRGDNKAGVSKQYALDKIIWGGLREKARLGMITHGQFWEQAVALGLSKEK